MMYPWKLTEPQQMTGVTCTMYSVRCQQVTSVGRLLGYNLLPNQRQLHLSVAS